MWGIAKVNPKSGIGSCRFLCAIIPATTGRLLLASERSLDSAALARNGKERHDSLPPSTVLRDYTIEKVIGHGGFGIVYRARHDELGLVVAIKEYLPIELAVRDGVTVRARSDADSEGYEEGLKRFREEARALIQFQDHPNVVSCREYFRTNGTAYLVMEYVDGQSLAQVLANREAEGAPFGESDLLAVMVPLLEGLSNVHEAWILHRDIKPSNILIRRRDGRPVLIDFGAAKQLVASRTKSMAPYTEGYAALEQVADAGELGPWTDIYGAGAVMWRMVAGGQRPWEPPNPVSVESRSHAFVRVSNDPLPSASELGKGRFSPKVLEAVDGCLALSETERVQGCKELLGMLVSPSSKPVEVPNDQPDSSNPERMEVDKPIESASGDGATVNEAGADPLELAGFTRRLVAAVVDVSVVVPLLFVFGILLAEMGPSWRKEETVFVTVSIGFMAYIIVLLALKSTTFGGLVARIRVIRSDGNLLQFADALRRACAVAFLAILVSSVTIFATVTLSELYPEPDTYGDMRPNALIRLYGPLTGAAVAAMGWLWALWDPRKQALHDKMADTYVIQTRLPHDIFRR